MKKMLCFACVACAAAFLFAGCGSADTDNGTETSEVSDVGSEAEVEEETGAAAETAAEEESEAETGTDTGSDAAADAEEVTLSEEDLELLETLGDDIQAVGVEDFAGTVQSFSEDEVGQVYQLTGCYIAGDSEEEEGSLESLDGDASIRLRYASAEMADGGRYTVTGIVAQDDDSNIVFDLVTVESYVEE